MKIQLSILFLLFILFSCKEDEVDEMELKVSAARKEIQGNWVLLEGTDVHYDNDGKTIDSLIRSDLPYLYTFGDKGGEIKFHDNTLRSFNYHLLSTAGKLVINFDLGIMLLPFEITAIPFEIATINSSSMVWVYNSPKFSLSDDGKMYSRTLTLSFKRSK